MQANSIQEIREVNLQKQANSVQAEKIILLLLVNNNNPCYHLWILNSQAQ